MIDSPRIDPIWDALNAGASPGRSAFSMIYLATTGSDGAPKLRTVVIRRLSKVNRAIGFNTDLRSPKIPELRTDNRVSVLAYDSEAGIQIRIDGEATLHQAGPVHAAAWTASSNQSRVSYRHAYAPGTPLLRPDLGNPTTDMIAPDSDDSGIENFCAIEILIRRIDYLELRSDGHRRSVFDWDDKGWIGRWVAP